jgi:hypothetical protein
MASEEDPTGRIRAAAFDLGIDGYEDAAVIGRGGFAVVYRARQRSFNRTVAVKVLSGADLDAAALRRFDRERAAIGALSGHPNIVTVYDSGFTTAGVPYLAMEYLSRGSLADHLHREGPMDWHAVLGLGVKLAGGLESAHRLGVLHRDIKPENVLVSNFGEPKLADFGIAHVVGGPETRSARLELSVLHAPPEVVDGKPAAEASDVYALASTLFALVRGRPPFLDDEDDSLVRLLVRIGTAPLPDLTALGVPQLLQLVFEKAMAKDPGARHTSALELGRALQGIEVDCGRTPTVLPLEEGVDDFETDAAPVAEVTESFAITVPAAGPEPSRRRSRVWGRLVAAASVAALLVAAGAVALAVRHRSSNASLADHRPVTTVPPATTAAAAVPLPRTPGTLAAGAYRSTTFRPDLRLQLDGGWTLLAADTPNALELARGDAPDAVLGFYMVDQAIDPASKPGRGKDVGATVRPLPADVRRWLLDHPRLRVNSTGPTSVGGRGWVADFTVTEGYRYDNGRVDDPCTRSACVLLFRTEEQPHANLVGAVAGEGDRFHLVPMGNRLFVVTVSGPAATHARFTAEAQTVLRTLSVTPS